MSLRCGNKKFYTLKTMFYIAFQIQSVTLKAWC